MCSWSRPVRRLAKGMAVLAMAIAQTVGAQEVFLPPAEPPSVRGVRTTDPVRLDGRLDEADWARAPVMRDFRQSNPHQGAPATFDTEVRLLFDDQYLYVGALLHDSLGWRGVRVRDLRRDFGETEGDYFGVHFDAFGDGRSSMSFLTNPYGAQRDLQSLDDQGRLLDVEWDAVWQVRTEVSNSGWTVEMAIPWSTLRYPPPSRPPPLHLVGRGASHAAGSGGTTEPAETVETVESAVPVPASREGSWRINFSRRLHRLNETSGWSPWPRAYSVLRMNYAGWLTGIEPPPPTTNLRVQPYLVLRGDRIRRPGLAGAGPQVEEELEPRVGGDLKWALTPNTVLDGTVNTDFAQADADIQEINLGRYSVFFPEKRQFFLENASLFTVGQGAWGEPFFSRRIGLDAQGRPLGIDGGVRLTHRSAERSAGALLIRQRGSEAQAASAFAVGRYIHNLGTQHRIGTLVVSRFDEAQGATPRGHNTVAAVDAFFRPTASSYVRGALGGSVTRGEGGDGLFANLHVAMNSNRGYLGWIQTYSSREYLPRTGFVPRRDLVITSPAGTLDWRPAWRPAWVQAFAPGFSTRVNHRASDLRFQEAFLRLNYLGLALRDGSQFQAFVEPEWQSLEHEFIPVPGMRIAPGDYRFAQYGVFYRPDVSRRLWTWVTLSTGGYFDGRRDRMVLRARGAPDPRLALTLDYVVNRLTGVGPEQVDETTHLLYPELRLALSPRTQLVGLYQYNSVAGTGAWNVRFAWEFRPLSYLYLVFNDRQPVDAALAGVAPIPSERQLILKFTYLWQL